MNRFLLLLIAVFCLCCPGYARTASERLRQAEELHALGLWSESAAVYDSIIDIGGRQSVMFSALSGRADCRRRTGDYPGALSDYDRALAIPAGIYNRTVLRLNRADVLMQLGKYKDVLREMDSIPDLDPAIRLRRAGNVAGALAREGEFERAAVEYINACEDSATRPIDRALLLQNLGFVRMEQGEWVGALEALRKSVTLYPQQDVPYYIMLSNLALAEALNGDAANAATHIDEALDAIRGLLSEEHADFIIALRKKGEIQLVNRDPEGAATTFRTFFTKERKRIENTFHRLSTQGRLDYWAMERPLLSQIFGIGEEDPDLLLDVALLRRAISLEEGRCDGFMRVTGKQLAEALRPEEAAVDFIAYPARDPRGRYKENLAAILVTPGNSHPRFIPLGSSGDLASRRVDRVSLREAVASSRVRDKRHLYTDSLLSFKLLGEVFRQLPSGTKHLYFALDGILQFIALENMWRPAEWENLRMSRLTNLAYLTRKEDSPSEVKKILVAGGLDYDAPPAEENEEVAAPDKETYEFLKSYFYPRRPKFSPLPGTGKEAVAIDSLLNGSVLTEELSEEEFKRGAGRFPRIHLATHGYSLPMPETPVVLDRDSLVADNSLRASGIVLSGANVLNDTPGKEDGLLSAREVCDLDLSGVDLLVLAACQTALGHISDEGPAGMVRGFKKAGVRRVLATLWEVDDEATLMFMSRFYAALTAGKSLDEALARARKEVREYKELQPVIKYRYDPAAQCSRPVDTGEKREVYPFSEPFYWAGFILYDNIERSSRKTGR